jgi:hypothetical protein
MKISEVSVQGKKLKKKKDRKQKKLANIYLFISEGRFCLSMKSLNFLYKVLTYLLDLFLGSFQVLWQ